jgi:hypothetical protein
MPDKLGRTLVMGEQISIRSWPLLLLISYVVSAADSLRDRLRDIARGYLYQGVELSELEYQPQ